MTFEAASKNYLPAVVAIDLLIQPRTLLSSYKKRQNEKFICLECVKV